jgi:fructose-1,6-bisphosphatase/inositol monophosphatase family enzyme
MVTHGVRRAGSAALDLAYVASGRLDGFWESGDAQRLQRCFSRSVPVSDSSN